MGRKVEVGVGGEDEEVVEVLRGSLVVSVGELVLSKVVERQDRVLRELGESRLKMISSCKLEEGQKQE